jgi:hypothetical protein
MPGAPAVEALRAQQPGIKAGMKPAAIEAHSPPSLLTDLKGGTTEKGFKTPTETPTIVFQGLGELKVTSLKTSVTIKNSDIGTNDCASKTNCSCDCTVRLGCGSNTCH